MGLIFGESELLLWLVLLLGVLVGLICGDYLRDSVGLNRLLAAAAGIATAMLFWLVTVLVAIRQSSKSADATADKELPGSQDE